MADKETLLEDHPMLVQIEPEKKEVEAPKIEIPPPNISGEEQTPEPVKTLAGKNREASKVRQEQSPPRTEPVQKPKPMQVETIAMPGNGDDDEEEERHWDDDEESEAQGFGFQSTGNGGDDGENLFINTLLGLMSSFLPMIIGNWAKIDEYEVLKAEKSEIVPEGSFERVDAINNRNQATIATTIQAGTSQLREPLIATMSKRGLNPGPESTLLMGLGAMGYSLFSVTREIRKSNKAFIAELVEIQKEKKKKAEAEKETPKTKKGKEVEGNE